ncbi:MAG: hypothetical protein EBS83_05765 [Planctomycetia bacterium]|nr:hypothetical protein [Planctomycetia bacterium]
MDTVSERIDRIVDEFVDLDGREKLELLLDFANRLPPLSADHQARKQQEDRRVHECQTAGTDGERLRRPARRGRGWPPADGSD